MSFLLLLVTDIFQAQNPCYRRLLWIGYQEFIDPILATHFWSVFEHKGDYSARTGSWDWPKGCAWIAL